MRRKRPFCTLRVLRLDAPRYCPSGSRSKMKGAAHSSDFPGWHWTAWEGTAVLLMDKKEGRKVVMEPMSHEVLVVLGITAVKLCIVKVVSHLCFQSTSRHNPFLLLLPFVLLRRKNKYDLSYSERFWKVIQLCFTCELN